MYKKAILKRLTPAECFGGGACYLRFWTRATHWMKHELVVSQHRRSRLPDMPNSKLTSSHHVFHGVRTLGNGEIQTSILRSLDGPTPIQIHQTPIEQQNCVNRGSVSFNPKNSIPTFWQLFPFQLLRNTTRETKKKTKKTKQGPKKEQGQKKSP
jgi:hypothetical protein